MSEEKVVDCDYCEKQLNIDSSYPNQYGIHVCSQDYGANTTGIVYAVAQSPALKMDLDFCGMTCLANWVTKEMNNQ